jgi:hypothetical protein
VLGYTEPLAGALAAGYFLAMRRYGDQAQRYWTAIALGFLSGLARPTGLLLSIPGAVEGLRAVRASENRRSATAVKALAATAAPPAGLLVFLGYSRLAFHSWTLPFSEQTQKANRGHVINNPLHAFEHVWRHGGPHGHQVATMATLLIVLGALLLVLTGRRLPASYAAWALPAFVLATTSHDFTSPPRYVGAIFPLFIAVAAVVRRPWLEPVLIAGAAALLLWTTQIALHGYLVA